MIFKIKKTNFEKIFDPNKEKDINEKVIEIQKRKSPYRISQTGILLALNDAQKVKTIVYSLKKVPTSKSVVAEFTLMKK